MVAFITSPAWKARRDSLGQKADTFLIFLSVMSVFFVLINEVTEAITIPWIHSSWSVIMHSSRLFTWLAFLTVYLVLGATSHRKPWNYARKWWLEGVIIIAWNPWMGSVALVQDLNIVSLQSLLLIGMLAHVARVARWLISEAKHHPMVGVGAAFGVVITWGAAFMMLAEKGTFGTFGDSLFTVYMTGLTLGGPLSPQSSWGRIAFCVVAGAGVTMWAVYNSVIREWVHRVLFKENELIARIFEVVETIKVHMTNRTNQLDRLQGQIDTLNATVAAQKRELTLQRRMMREMHAFILHGTRPEELAPEAPVEAPPPQ